MDEVQAKALRAPFPPEAIGKIPKGGVKLDYVGHAAVTDRLLAVDPEWTWEPAGVSDYGLPVFDASNGLWIRLTVCGVTRYGYGDGPDPKQCISDAIRNAAMRYGVALDLWSKEELPSTGPSSPASGEGGSLARAVVSRTGPSAPVAGDTPLGSEDDGEAPSGPGTTSGGGEGSPGGDEPEPPSEAQDVWDQFEELCADAGVKSVPTFVKATHKPFNVAKLRAREYPEVSDIETAIGHVAALILKGA